MSKRAYIRPMACTRELSAIVDTIRNRLSFAEAQERAAHDLLDEAMADLTRVKSNAGRHYQDLDAITRMIREARAAAHIASGRMMRTDSPPGFMVTPEERAIFTDGTDDQIADVIERINARNGREVIKNGPKRR